MGKKKKAKKLEKIRCEELGLSKSRHYDDVDRTILATKIIDAAAGVLHAFNAMDDASFIIRKKSGGR